MEEDQCAIDTQLKFDINQFVWTHAPSKMTFAEGEELACDIFYKFDEARKKLAMDNIR